MLTESALASQVEETDQKALEIEFTRKSQSKLAFEDFLQGLLYWQAWLLLAYQDIKLRYRRSTLGPFWITIGMAITVYSMGFLYAHLFHTDLQHYYPFLVAGMLSWSLISNTFIELTDTFTSSEGYIKQIKLPYHFYLHRVLTRNLIIFFHNLLVIIPILILFHEVAKVNFATLLLIINLIIEYSTAIVYGLIFAMVGARYRDISQMIKSLIQVAFFVTPIMWNPEILSEKNRYLVDWNPFASLVELIRAPLLGQIPSLWNYTMVFMLTFIGFMICARLFPRYRARIVYWV